MPFVAGCHGNGADHCCYWAQNGVQIVCPFLEQNTVAGRRWSCQLLREDGSWAAAHADPRYAQVEALWRSSGDGWEGIWLLGIRCGGWPQDISNIKQGDINRLAEPYKSAVNRLKNYALGVLADLNAGRAGNESLCCFGGRVAV